MNKYSAPISTSRRRHFALTVLRAHQNPLTQAEREAARQAEKDKEMLLKEFRMWMKMPKEDLKG